MWPFKASRIVGKTGTGNRNRQLGAVAATIAMLALMAAAVACDADEPTVVPPTAAAVVPSPTPTQEPSATPVPDPTATPATEPTPAPTPTSIPTPAATSTPEPAATPAADLPTVREILDAVVVAQAAVETGSIAIEVTATQGGVTPVETSFTISGDFQAPDRSRFTTVVSTGGLSSEFDSIVIGDEAYQQDPLSGEWDASPDALGVAGESGYLGKLLPVFEDYASAPLTLVGVENRDGVQVYILEGSLPASDADFLPGDVGVLEDAPDAPLDLEVWIGVEDSLLRRLEYGSQYTDELTGHSTATHTVVTYLDYGKEVDIQAPEVSQPDFSITLPGGLDDHGNDQSSATLISVDKAVEGTIDNLFDYDFFLFQAEEGQTYVIEVALGTLTDSAVGLYDAGGDVEVWNNDYGDSLGSRIKWTARASGDYFLTVEGFDVDSSGTYTLALTLLTDEDDHGGDPTSGTDITFDEAVRGLIDSALDHDYFVFRADEGQEYRIVVDLITLGHSAMGVFDSQGRQQAWNDDYQGTQASQITWTAPASGEYFLNVKSGDGSDGSYLVRISEVRTGQGAS